MHLFFTQIFFNELYLKKLHIFIMKVLWIYIFNAQIKVTESAHKLYWNNEISYLSWQCYEYFCWPMFCLQQSYWPMVCYLLLLALHIDCLMHSIHDQISTKMFTFWSHGNSTLGK
jgi:hypothetical protein